MSRPLEKVVVAQLLDAAKCYLDHVRRWQIDASEGRRVPQVPRELASIYGSVRRLKDHLQRVLASFPLPETLDVDADDLNLLAGCAVHLIGQLEANDLAERQPPSEREWLLERVKSLAHWVDQFSSPPFDRLPCPDPIKFATPTAKELIARARTRRAGLSEPSGFIRFRGAGFGDGVATTQWSGDAAPAPRREPAGARLAMPDTGMSGTMALGRELPAFGGGPSPAPAAPAASAASTTVAAPAAATPATPAPAETLLDAQLVREPRLRAVVTMDLAALERALAVQDHRMSMIHFASLAEALIVDHALTRRAELGLQGNPETWKLEELLVRLLEDRTSAMERGFLGHLLATRNLLSPATQIHSPVVVTSQTVGLAREFLKHLLHQLGYHGQSRSGLLRAVR